MGRPPGEGDPSAASANKIDAGLRETTANSLARWWRRLDSGSSWEGDLIAREAAQLGALAQSRGAGALADQLSRVSVCAHAAPSILHQALDELAALAGLPPRAGAPAPAAAFGGTVLASARAAGPSMPSAAYPPSPLVPPPVAAPVAPVRPSPPPADGAAPPSMLFSGPPIVAGPPLMKSRIAQGPLPGAGHEAGGLPSLKEPPLARPPVVLDAGGTRVSQGIDPAVLPKGVSLPSPPPQIRESLPAKALSAGSRPRAESPPPAPARSHPEPPWSVAPPIAPPKLLGGTFLGFRAFGKSKTGGEKPEASGGPEPAGLLGLAGRRPRASWPAEGRPGAGAPEMPVRPRRSDPLVDEGRPRRKVTSSASPGFAVPRWFYFVVVAIGALAVSVGIVIAVSARNARNAALEAPPKPSSSGSASAIASVPAAPLAPPIVGGDTAPHSDDGFAALLHGHGAETPQLRALLDAQDRLVQACRHDAAACGRGWTPRARDALNPIDKASVVFTPPPDGPLPGWLRDLKMPSDFPIHDEPALRSPFDFGTKNIAGRQGFQSKLFQCSAYTDIFDSTLLKYGAPHWLTAVVYQESGCNRSAESPVGAKGLWQFMPESARAYGLRVVEGEIDERLNPIKSTEAAIHFLTDLQRKLGAWDLALAGYNMGPYAVLARLTQVGEKAGFWELAHAGLLPDETAGYVPSIEAYALMLQNLNRLQFNPYGKRLDSTAEILVKPGTRLSLLARASSTTTVHIRDLNPEFLRDVVPDGETTARVPDTEAHRAQAFVDSWSPSDNRDTCVPPDFDWGAQPFESSRYAKTCASGAPVGP